MEAILLIPQPDNITIRRTGLNYSGPGLSREKAVYDPFIENLVAEGGENFLFYLRGLGLAHKPNIMVLTSRRSNYYDRNDLKGISTLINLKKLNRMRHLDSFLSTVRAIVPPETNFIGCYSDSSNFVRNRLLQKNSGRINNCSDSFYYRQFSTDDILLLFKSHGFNIYDITEIKGLTYFRARPDVGQKL
jgi:hypothetical protein